MSNKHPIDQNIHEEFEEEMGESSEDDERERIDMNSEDHHEISRIFFHVPLCRKIWKIFETEITEKMSVT